jgi:hypothetical protein
MLLGGGSQRPQAKPFPENSLLGNLLEPITGFWQALTDNWIHPNIENDSEMKQETEERKWHRMAKVHDILEMWQGSQNL